MLILEKLPEQAQVLKPDLDGIRVDTADKGEKLMEIQTGLKGGMGPPITYMIDGKQYVTITGGTGVVVARNIEPGAPLPQPNASTVFPKMMTFVLDGQPMPK